MFVEGGGNKPSIAAAKVLERDINRMTGSETSKVMVRKVFAGGKLAWIPFMPWVCIHAARLEQLPVQKMLSDPSLLARALQNAHKLYGYDMGVNIFDPTIEAEACGCAVKWTSDRELPVIENHPPIDQMGDDAISNLRNKGRLPVVLEATKRLKINLGRAIAIAGVVTGPFTLASHLKGGNIIDGLDRHPEQAKKIVELAGKVCLEVCKSYGELELDLIVLADSVMPQLPIRNLPLVLSVLKPLVNVIRFYNSVPLLLANGCTQDSLELLTKTDVDGMVVDGGIESDIRQKIPHCVVGRTIPSSVLKGPKDELIRYIKDCLKKDARGLFISTEWQVPYDTPPENMREIIKSIRGD
jgi:uroporphyrinogen decarboxylase